MASVSLQSVGKSFGGVRVLTDINLDIADGEFLTLVGASGCGKSTLIRIIAGLEPQSTGSVLIDGVPADHLRPHERHVAMVFQSYALYPHMKVFANIALPLVMSRLRLFERLPVLRLLSARRRSVMAGIADEVHAVARQLQIEALLERRPSQLSGGQRQRVALGRAMVRQPAAFLMDEPLSNLDAKLRVHMRSELAELHARLGVTMVYVTHDQVEAMTMADRLAVMDQGVILQLGTPSEVYERPASVTVAQFIGSPGINLLPAKVGPNGVVEIATAALPLRVDAPEGSALTVGVRPESIHVRPESGDGRVACRFHRRENLGSESILHFDVLGVENLKLLAKVAHGGEGADTLPEGPTEVGFAPASCHVFDASGRRLATETHGPAARRDERAIAMGHAQ